MLKNYRKCIVLATLFVMVFTIPVFALFDDNSKNLKQQQIAEGGDSNAKAISESKSKAISESESVAISEQKQDQISEQLGVVSPAQSVGGDKEYAYFLTSPNTTAGDGQSAMSLFSLFGGVNVAESAEYKICIEKINLLTAMQTNGLITKEDAIAKAALVYAELDEATRAKRWFWIGPKTRGKHAGNLLGLVAMDSCQEINTDNWLGLKNLLMKKK